MHEECGRAALSLCPHINRPNMRRAKSHKIKGETYEPGEAAILQRPDMWVMTITRGYKKRIQPGGSVLFVAQPYIRAYGWRNLPDEPGLVEIDETEVGEAIKNAL